MNYKKIGALLLAALFSVALFAQTKVQQVTGKITDASGLPVIGVTVLEQGTNNATSTEEDGSYSIKVKSSQSILDYILIGYLQQSRQVGNNSVIDVVMTEDVAQLNDVIVIGYGTTTKKEVTGSVANVKSQDVVIGSIENPYEMLQGKVAGLNVIRSDGGDPNGGYSINLRGTTTMSAGSEPLVIIDNVIGGNLETLNPEEIETIDVLKDGSAAAIYGTRGTNGVILITTKKAKGNDSFDVEFSTYAGVQTVMRKLRMLTADEFRKVIASGHTGTDAGSNTDWLDAISNKAPISQYYNLASSGSSKHVSYRADVSYFKEQGLVLKSDRQTLKGRINITQKAIDDRLTLNYSLNYSTSQGHPTDKWVIQQAVRRNPTEPIYDESDIEHGGYYYNGGPFEYYNPVAMLNESQHEYYRKIAMGSVKASFKITDDLNASATGSITDNSYNYGQYWGKFYPQYLGYNGIADIYNDMSIEKLLDLSLDYNKKFGDHSIQAVGGYSYSDYLYQNNSSHNYSFDTDYYSFNNIGTGAALQDGKATMDSYKESSKLIAFYGRAMYNYKEKYLLSLSARYEGSTKFGSNNKWGLFPAISVGWRISQESFMKDIKWLDELKLRVGYGITGNQEIDPYQSLARLSTSGKFYYNGSWVNTYGPSSNANDDLQWERKAEFDLGLDFAILNGRVSGTIDYYNRTTSNLLYTYSVPVPPNLYDQKFTNVGVIVNSGIEMTLNTIPFKTKEFTWNSMFTIAHNSNILKSFSNKDYAMQYLDEGYISTDFKQYVERIYEGQPIGNFYGPVFTGMDADGKATYKGVAAGEAVSDKVYEVIGNAYPAVTMGWTNNLTFGNWNLSMLLRASVGNQIANIQRLFYEGYYYFGGKNILHSTLDSPNNAGQTTWSSWYVEDGSFLKLSNLSLSYTFHPQVDWMKSLKVYATGQNLLCLTKYKGVDPEVSLNGLAPGIAWYEYYPMTRTIMLGVNITF